MSESAHAFLNAQDLLAFAVAHPARPGCPACAELRCPGWESLPGSFARSRLHRLGTLRQAGDDDPTVAEYHPRGTNAWSIDAPIAWGYFPYNQCEIWACTACQRPFLRYTEAGGYYTDERIRELDARWVVDPAN